MGKTDSPNKIFNFRKVIKAFALGFALYLLLCLMMSALTFKGAIAQEIIMKYGAYVSLFLSVLIMCLTIGKGRGAPLGNKAVATAALWFWSIILSFAFNENAELKSTLPSLFICIAAIFIVSIPKTKNGKMHKRRYRQ